jgi:hypothetical protein
MDHILLRCFSKKVWHIWLVWLHLEIHVADEEVQALHWWLNARKMVPTVLRRGFDSFFFLIGWMIWKEQNARTFNGVASTAVQLADAIHNEAQQW